MMKYIIFKNTIETMMGISKVKWSYQEREPVVRGFLRRSFEPTSEFCIG
jgi:hypothetical protein